MPAKKNQNLLIRLIFSGTIPFLIFNTPALASPIPGTAGSALVSPQSGLFYAGRGFRLKAQPDWKVETNLESPTEVGREFSVQYIHPIFKTARLSVQTDTLKSELTLEAYTKKWMKDYSSYGFDVLGAKTFQTSNAKGLVVDLHHKKKQTQLRQVIFVKNKTAVVLTCLDQVQAFPKSLAGCNLMARSFQWTQK